MRSTWRVMTAAAAVSTAVLVALGTGDSDFLTLHPGPTPPVGEAVSVTDPVAGKPSPQSGKGRVLITTVAATRMSRVAALRCQVRPSCEAITADDSYLGAANTQMAQSVTHADAAATAIAGELARWPHAPGKVTVPGIGGPSAGLALTLHLLDARVPGELLGDRTIAATGSITATGDVGAVGGVALKATGAARAGADLMFVPAAEEGQARTSQPDLTVVPVRTARDAVTWLCEHGATSDLCGTHRTT